MPKKTTPTDRNFFDRRDTWCYSFSKKVTLTAYFIFAASALCLIITGAVLYHELRHFSTVAYKVTFPIGLVVLGLVVIFASFLGVAGILRDQKVCVKISLGVLVILIICEFGVAFGAYSLMKINRLNSQFEAAWDHLSDGDRNSIQTSSGCCGFFNATDFPGSNCWQNSTTNSTTTGHFVWNSTTGGGLLFSSTGGFSPGTSGESGGSATTGSNGAPSTTESSNWPATTGSNGAPSTTQSSNGLATTALMPNSTGTSDKRRIFKRGIQATQKPGCRSALVNKYRYAFYVVGTVGVIFTLFQLIGLLFTSIMICLIRWRKRQAGYSAQDDTNEMK